MTVEGTTAICVKHYDVQNEWTCPNKVTGTPEALISSGETIEIGQCSSGKVLYVCKLCLEKYPESLILLEEKYPNINIRERIEEALD